MPELTLRRGGPADAAAVLALFDEAVAWLTARGQTGQWGSEPWSRRASAVARADEWAAGDGLWLAGDGDRVVGALVVGNRPPHVAPIAESELYVVALVTSRARAGEGIGARLLAHAAALARDAGVGVLRVDCWAGAPPLVAFYEGQGFARSGSFAVGGWRGQVLTMRDP